MTIQIQLIDSLLNTYLTNLTKCGTFHVSNETDEIEPASTLLWLQYYLAQHYDHLGQIDKAFQFIDQAIHDTPTLVELYMFKAKIFKVNFIRFRNKKAKSRFIYFLSMLETFNRLQPGWMKLNHLIQLIDLLIVNVRNIYYVQIK